MNEEIKEIFKTKLYFDLEDEDYIKIQDYITNLQQEIDRLKELEQEHRKINGELRVKIQELQKAIIATQDSELISLLNDTNN